jgi:dipeptidyl aminopeptidase/acylaminoacyl peptidase
MFENEDIPTATRPTSPVEADTRPTVQVPAVQPTTVPPSHPYITVEDLLAIQLVGNPQISPDGTHIAFTVQRCIPETNTTSSTIWLVSTTGGKAETPRQLTRDNAGGQHDTAPRWSPDGSMLAFLSDRTGSMQIYVLPMNGGEAHQVSNLNRGVSEYSWRPDGTALLVHSGWKPGDDNKVPDTSNIVVVYTSLGEQWDGIGYKHGQRQQLWLVPLEGTPTRLTSEPVDVVQSCWSPDGTEIAFCANRRPDPDLSASMALWVLTLATGQMRRLTPEEGLAQFPSWSPDGQSIAYYYVPDQTEASNVSPWIVDAHGTSAAHPATSHSQDITCIQWVIDELHSYTESRPQWYPDSKALLVTVQERGQVHLYRLDLEHDQHVALTGGTGCYLDPNLSKDGTSIAAVRIDWFTPGDIWSMDGNGTNRRKLTGVNDTFLRSHQWIRPKRITWQSFDGQTIEAWLYLPPLPEGAKAPLILEVHGGPTLAWGDAYVHEFQVLAGHGFAVLAANPRGSAGYGEAFCRKILNDWGGDDFRDLMAGIDHVLATEPIDGIRLGIGGLSYGGYMTNWALTQTNRFKAGVSRNGISYLPTCSLLSDQAIWFDLSINDGVQGDEGLQYKRSALPFADRITAPLLLLHAENDLRCPFSESMQLFVALRKRKHTVELVRYSNVSHLMDFPEVGTPQQRVDRLHHTVEWFERFV